MSSTYFLPYQQRWIDDSSRLKIIEKSRQIGITYADAFDSVIKASRRDHGRGDFQSPLTQNKKARHYSGPIPGSRLEVGGHTKSEPALPVNDS